MLKRPEPLEWQIQKAIVDRMRWEMKGWLVFHVPNRAGPGTDTDKTIKMGMAAGCPDLVIVRDKDFIAFLEVKRPKARLTDSQVYIHVELLKKGVRVATVSSEDEAIAALELEDACWGLGCPHRPESDYDAAVKRVFPETPHIHYDFPKP